MKHYLIILLLLFTLNLKAQPVVENEPQTSSVPMADVMRSDGKIYIVVAVLATIMAGIVVYLVRLDNKISKLESEIEPKSKVKTSI